MKAKKTKKIDFSEVLKSLAKDIDSIISKSEGEFKFFKVGFGKGMERGINKGIYMGILYSSVAVVFGFLISLIIAN